MNRSANLRHAAAAREHRPNDENGFVFMAVGLPGSGKSTFFRGFAESQGINLVSADDIRHELTGSEATLTQDETVWEVFASRVAASLAEQRSVALDSTNLERDRRMSDISRYRELGARSVIAVVFDIPFSVALARNTVRGRAGGREVPYYAMKRMHGRFRREPVSTDEGFDDIIRVDNTR